MEKSTVQVLLIEDNPADVLLLKDSLRNDALANFQVTVVENLKLGLTELAQRKFDVLLLDLGLPDSQGLETFEAIQAHFPNIPVIVLSGMADEWVAQQSVQSGAQDYFVKGESGWNLGPRAIRYAIERHQSQLEMRASETRFSTIFHSSPTSIAITRLSDNQILEVNEAWSQITGYSPAEVIGRILNEFNLWVRLEDRDQVIAKLRQEGVVHDFEFQMRRKSGEIADLLFSAELLELAGEPCMLSMALDITERKRADEALRHSEERHRQISTLMSDYVYSGWVYPDGTTNTEWVSGAFERITGYSIEEVNQLPGGFPSLLFPEDYQEVIRQQPTLIEKGMLYMEYRIRRKDGEIRWLSDYMHHIKSDGLGDPVLLLGAVQDITGRKRAELALLENEAKLKDAERNAHLGYYDIDILTGKTIWSDETYRIFGLDPADYDPNLSNYSRHIHPEDAQKVYELYDECIREQKPFDLVYRIVRADGEVRYVHSISTVKADEQNNLTRLFGTFQDVTERKQAEESIRRSEQQMQALLGSLDDIVFEFDERGTYLNIWAADENLLVMPKTEMLGKQALEVMGEEEGRLVLNAVRRIMAGGPPESVEYQLGVLSGQRWFMARISPILDHDGSPRSVSVLVRDITERREIEEQVRVQLQRMRALNEIDRAISSSLDMRLSLDILLNQSLLQLGIDAVCILLLNPSSQTLEYAAGKGFNLLAIRKSRVLLGQGLAGKVGLERKMLHVPDLNVAGPEFLRRELLKEERFVEYFGIPLIAKGVLKGVLEVFQRTPLAADLEWLNYLETLGGQAAIAIDNSQLFEGMQRSNLELVTAYDATIEGWSRAMDLRDKETEGHTLRVTELTVQLAKRMGINQHEITQIRRGALLHDIGKLGVPDHTLHKPDKLDRFEWAVMRQHPTYAFNMLLPINYLRPALDIPYCHHEKWDGTGYPRGLKGEEIPLAARLFAVVDVWDALRSDRPYRKGWPDEQVREHLMSEAGKHFDARVLDVFLELLNEMSESG